MKTDKPKMLKIYMRVSKDKYRLPEAFAESSTQLAKICGTSSKSIDSVISKWRHGKYKNPRYIMVEIEVDQ